MNMLFGQKLNLRDVPAAGEYTPLPEGVYPVICTEFDVETKNNAKGDLVTGAKVKFQVIEGQYAGRKVSDYLIIMHSGSSQAQDIGQRRLRSWCDALGIPPELDSAEPLLHKPVKAKLKIDPARTVGDRTFSAQNRVETFYPGESAPASAPVAKLAPRPAATPATTPAAAAVAASPVKAMPWKK